MWKVLAVHKDRLQSGCGILAQTRYGAPPTEVLHP